MHARFHAPAAAAPGDVVPLPDDEAQHLTRVLRLSAGSAVRIFNGRGAEFDAVVEEAHKDHVSVRVTGTRDPAPEPRVAVTMVHAVLKGDKMDDVVRDLVMMGAAVIQPVVTARSEVGLATLTRAHRRERWERIAVASTKQCGRAVVPRILVPLGFDGTLHALGARTLPLPALLFAEPGASPDALALGELEGESPAEVTVIVGPEGGWTHEEIEAASRFARIVTIGRRTLRADVIGIAALAALFAHWREY